MLTKFHILLISFFLSVGGYAQLQNNGNLRMHSGAVMGLYGNFTNNGTFTNNLGSLQVLGTNAQIFNGDSIIHATKFIINKTSNSLQLDNELQIAGVFTFTNGKILSDQADTATEFVHFLDGSSYTGASNTSHIEGVIRKTGNDAFVFPTGDSSLLRTVSISAPGDINDHFTAYYTAVDPHSLYSRGSLAVGIHHVSACEYWILNRTGGSSNVEVTLSWETSSCGVNNLCDLLVTRWDGTQWTTEGNGGTTGDTLSGTLVSGSSCTTPDSVTNFSPFTLGSVSSNNILPIKLTSFYAEKCDEQVCLSWQTSAEINNDYFTIERSKDAIDFESIAFVKGAGNSNVILNYNDVDQYPLPGISYYRLKQTDFNNDYEYSKVVSIIRGQESGQSLLIYPNPVSNQITIEGSEIDHISIFNVYGQDVTFRTERIENNEVKVILDLSNLSVGIYYLKVNAITYKVSKQ